MSTLSGLPSRVCRSQCAEACSKVSNSCSFSSCNLLPGPLERLTHDRVDPFVRRRLEGSGVLTSGARARRFANFGPSPRIQMPEQSNTI